MRLTDISSVDLNLLVALDALLEAGSVTGAARRLRRSQPAVSRMLARLRDLLGDPLLVAQGRGLAPTPRAVALRGPLRLLLSDAELLVHPPRPFDPAETPAHFRIVSSDYAQVTVLGGVMSWLARTAPGVTMEVLPVSPEALDRLAGGTAELLLGPPELCPRWCEHEPLLADPWFSVRRRGAPAPATVERYLAAAHVAVATELAGGSPVDEALRRRAGRARPVKLTVPDFAGALFVAATSPLVATVPGPVARAGAALLPLAQAPVPFEVTSQGIEMIWPSRLTRAPAHAWLRRAVLRSLSLQAG